MILWSTVSEHNEIHRLEQTMQYLCTNTLHFFILVPPPLIAGMHASTILPKALKNGMLFQI